MPLRCHREANLLFSKRRCHGVVSKLALGSLVAGLALCRASAGLIGPGGVGYAPRGHGTGEGQRREEIKPLVNGGGAGRRGTVSGQRKTPLKWRGGGKLGTNPAAGRDKPSTKTDVAARVRPGTMESDSLLAGNVQRLHFLRKKTGIDLGATVFALYSMAIRRVLGTIGQPLRSARARRANLIAAVAVEKAASKLTEGLGEGVVGAAAEAAAQEALEAMPFPYLPSVGALLLMLMAVAAHTLLLLGKRWSVRFNAWSSFEEVLTWQEADAVLVTPVRHTGTPAICLLKGTPRSLGQGQDGADESEEKEGAEAMEDGVYYKAKDSKEGTSEEALSSEEESCGHLSEGGDFSSQEEHEKPVEEDSDAADERGRGSEVTRKTSESPSFVYQRRKFILNDAAGKGDGEGGHGGEGETFGLVELPVGWPLGRYLEAQGLSLEDLPERLETFGKNSVDVKPPTFWHHLGERLTSPFVVFSLFNQVLWMLELYWLKALVAIFEVVAFEAAFVADAERRRRQLDIRNAKRPEKRVRAWRGGTWVYIPVDQMLPGDVVSLRAGVTAGGDDFEGKEKKEEAFAVGELPADVLLLRGTAVVDEASLTGESVPQIKTSLASEPIDIEDPLDMTGRHSSHVLLSGTTLLDQTDGSDDETQHPTGAGSTTFGASSLPDSTPDGGALCYVLRTGVYSFQGNLRRTIDFGNHDVREESKDAAYLLLFLLSFAALSSCHVVREGLKSNQVSGFRLLVQCVRIISAVVPNDLSFELNQCLRNGVLSLQKDHALACTEPFRIPLAGKVNVCLFDKTGTITSDRLLAETLVTPQPTDTNGPPVTVKLGRIAKGGKSSSALERASDTVVGARGRLAAEAVIGGCHSLMNMDGVLHGDPLEASALEGIRWAWNATSHTAHPQHSDGFNSSETVALESNSSSKPQPDETSGSTRRPNADVASGNSGEFSEDELLSDEPEYTETKSEALRGAGGGIAEGVGVVVWRRYAFSSQLQRMSVVAEVSGSGLIADSGVPEAWVLCKGSPEAMRPLLNKTALPEWYDQEYDRLARAGRRVIALAHRTLGPSQPEGSKEKAMSLPREQAEAEASLTFDGFLSFHCKTRKDSSTVIRDLQEVAGCSVTIVTGDSVLTASHVASEVGLIASEAAGNNMAKRKKGSKKSKKRPKKTATKDGERKTALLLTVTEHGELRWVPLHPRVASAEKAGKPAANESAKKTATERSDSAGDGASRIAPGKEEESRTSDEEMGFDFAWEGVEGLAGTYDLCATGPAFDAAINDGSPDIGRYVQHFRVLARMTPGLKEELATLLIEAGKTVLMCGDGSNDVGALRRSHVGIALLSGFGDANTAADVTTNKTETQGPADRTEPAHAGPGEKAVGEERGDEKAGGALKGKSQEEIQKEGRERIQADVEIEFERLRGEGISPAKAMWKAGQIAQKKRVEVAAKAGGGAQGAFAASAMAMFKDGEEQQGAEGVVRTGDASLAAPFTSKKPSIAAVVDVVRQGRCTLAAVLHTYQMVALHALFSSYTSSVLYLMKVRWPQRPLIATSLLFQPLHLALASPGTPRDLSPLRPPRSVFHQSTFVSLLGQAGVHVACMAFAVRVAQAHSPVAQTASPGGGLRPKFVPNMVSNTVFLLSTIQAVSVSLVNFKGRPFMQGILESRAIFLPAMAIVAFCFAVAFEVVPAANKLLEMAVFPSMAVKTPILVAMAVSLVGPLAVDRLCVRLFDADLHRARTTAVPLGSEAKGNLLLLGVMLVVAATAVARTDFDDLGDTFGASE